MNRTTSSDRLSFTLVISVILHLVVLLGVSFNVLTPPSNSPINNLEITLVKQQQSKAPEKADFLAQANNEGGGEFDQKTPTPSPDMPTPRIEETPASKQIEPLPPAETEIISEAPVDVPQPPVVEPTPEPEPVAEVVKPEPKPEPAPVPKPEPKPEKQKVKAVTQAKAERKIEKVETPGETVEEEIKSEPKLSAKDLMLKARSEIQQLQDQLDKSTKSLSERPKKRRISASTKEYAAAAYMKAWEMKVERIGNMNYPQEARQKGLNGNLMLSVDINPDGSVPPGGIVVSRSSGHKVLDDAAIKIVRLGAPYAAIPDNVLKSNDMLTIIRTWKFETNRGLSTR